MREWAKYALGKEQRNVLIKKLTKRPWLIALLSVLGGGTAIILFVLARRLAAHAAAPDPNRRISIHSVAIAGQGKVQVDFTYTCRPDSGIVYVDLFLEDYDTGATTSTFIGSSCDSKTHETAIVVPSGSHGKFFELRDPVTATTTLTNKTHGAVGHTAFDKEDTYIGVP